MRVVVTGMGVMTSLGNSVDEMFCALMKNQSRIRSFDEWKQYRGLNSYLGAPVPEFDSKIIPRAHRRSMSRMSEMSYLATLQAQEQAGISLDSKAYGNPLDFERTLLNIGSTAGSGAALEEYHRKLFERNGPEGQLATSFFKVMNHSVVANVAVAFGYVGPILSTPSACSTSSHAAILGAELIKAGIYDLVIAGGADELHYTGAATFDIVGAASRGYNDRPDEASRPFDKDRDGLVISEGASTIILESEEHALRRGARPLAEFLGGAYLCDGTHMTQPQESIMTKTMCLALKRANVQPEKINHVNAHATATIIGDIEESKAIFNVFSDKVPVSSLKGHFGHSLAACGLVELIASIKMLEQQVIIPTRNLHCKEPKCANILLPQKLVHDQIRTVISNNFAFGGINTSMVIAAYE